MGLAHLKFAKHPRLAHPNFTILDDMQYNFLDILVGCVQDIVKIVTRTPVIGSHLPYSGAKHTLVFSGAATV